MKSTFTKVWTVTYRTQSGDYQREFSNIEHAISERHFLIANYQISGPVRIQAKVVETLS